MLARAYRLRQSQDFRATIRAGRRSASSTLVTHVVPGASSRTTVGFVVSKAVGPAVVRNRVKRRLRHLVRNYLFQLPAGSSLVVRALPKSADASSAALEADLCKALTKSGVL